MNKKLFIILAASLCIGLSNFHKIPSHGQARQEEQTIDDDNSEIQSIVIDIKENGPPSLRQLPSSVIESSARAFVTGRRSGAISAAQLERLGGSRIATERTLMGELKALEQ